MKPGRNAFNYDFAATVLIDAFLTSVAQASETHDVSQQTIYRYSKQMASDEKLLEIVNLKKAALDIKLEPPSEPTVAEVLASARGFLMRATKEAFAFSPDCITAIATAYGILSDKEMARETLGVYLDALRNQNGGPIGGSYAQRTEQPTSPAKA